MTSFRKTKKKLKKQLVSKKRLSYEEAINKHTKHVGGEPLRGILA